VYLYIQNQKAIATSKIQEQLLLTTLLAVMRGDLRDDHCLITIKYHARRSVAGGGNRSTSRSCTGDGAEAEAAGSRITAVKQFGNEIERATARESPSF
jgi:hypothetical protein